MSALDDLIHKSGVLDPSAAEAELFALRMRVRELEAMIRKHRDARGHERCKENNAELYRLIDLGETPDPELPSREEWLHECGRYYDEEKRTPVPHTDEKQTPKET